MALQQDVLSHLRPVSFLKSNNHLMYFPLALEKQARYIKFMKIKNITKSWGASLLLVSVFAGFAPISSFSQTLVSTSVRISGSCSKCDLSHRAMLGMRLENSNFSGSDFSGTNLSGSVLNNSNLTGTSFHKAYLLRVKGENVILKNSVLRNATLTKSKLIKSNFTFADLRRTDLSFSDLSDSDFTGANLNGVDALETQFLGAHFEQTTFNHGNFKDADFSGANFVNVNFGDAILTNSSFKNARFTQTDFSNVANLKQRQFVGACGDEHTRLSETLVLPICVTVSPPIFADNTLAKTALPSEIQLFSAEATNPSKAPSTMPPAPSEIGLAIRELNAALNDLPLGSPTRKRLMKSRKHMENLRASQP
ncbi:MAG: pentapeptide repeat-containing protein [Robiginitomaculum sp.]